MKLAVLFPGIGYTCDKPLLYYSARLAQELGYHVLPVRYGNLPKNTGGAPGMRACLDAAMAQVEPQLADAPWNGAKDLLFIGKSLGTLVACGYAQVHELPVRGILLTPLEETFQFETGPAIAFHGTADPWARTPIIQARCADRNIPLYLTEDANHSLETGDLRRDLETLAAVMRRERRFILDIDGTEAPEHT